MILCIVNSEKLKNLTPRKELAITQINLLSLEGADSAIYLVTKMFSMRKGNYHLKFWIGGSIYGTGYLYQEVKITHGKIEFIDE